MSDIAVRISGLSKRYRLGATSMVSDRITERLAALPGLLARPDRAPTERVDARDLWALRDVTLDVTAGDAVGIVGRNGAGKTTLLKILARITPPSEGRIEFRGRVSSLLEVGTGFHPDLSGRDNVFLNGAIMGMSRAEVRRKLDAIVAFAEVERFIDTPVKRYSSGMYVRLAFAVAAHLEPDILLVDEVLSVGDASFRRKSLGRMHETASSGRTVIFVSHDLGAVAELTRSCLYLAGGRVQSFGPTHEVVRRYLADNRADDPAGPLRDLARYRRGTAEDAPARVARVEVVTPDGSEALPVGAPLEMAMAFDVERAVELLTVTVIIRGEDGRVITVLYSPDQGFRLTSRPGTVEVVLRVGDISLTPGAYFADVGLSEGPGTVAHDVVLGVPILEVVNSGEVVHWLDRPWGVVHPRDVTWRLAA